MHISPFTHAFIAFLLTIQCGVCSAVTENEGLSVFGPQEQMPLRNAKLQDRKQAFLDDLVSRMTIPELGKI